MTWIALQIAHSQFTECAQSQSEYAASKILNIIDNQAVERLELTFERILIFSIDSLLFQLHMQVENFSFNPNGSFKNCFHTQFEIKNTCSKVVLFLKIIGVEKRRIWSYGLSCIFSTKHFHIEMNWSWVSSNSTVPTVPTLLNWLVTYKNVFLDALSPTMGETNLHPCNIEFIKEK